MFNLTKQLIETLDVCITFGDTNIIILCLFYFPLFILADLFVLPYAIIKAPLKSISSKLKYYNLLKKIK